MGSGGVGVSFDLLFFVNMTACFQKLYWIICFTVEKHLKVKVISGTSSGRAHLPHEIAHFDRIAL
jgi:hypothetical protein